MARIKERYKNRAEQAKDLEKAYDQYLRADKSLNYATADNGETGIKYKNGQRNAYNATTRFSNPQIAKKYAWSYAQAKYNLRSQQLRDALNNRINAIKSAAVGGNG